MLIATVSTEAVCILPTGRGGRVQPGVYEVAELDGTDGELWLMVDGELRQVDPHDRAIVVEDAA